MVKGKSLEKKENASKVKSFTCVVRRRRTTQTFAFSFSSDFYTQT